MKYSDIYTAIAAEAKGVREISRGALDIGYTRKDIEYLMVSQDGKTINKKTAAIAIFNPNTEEEEAYYIGGESKVSGEPEILKESPTPPEIREAYHTEEQYTTSVETEFPDWGVLRLRISIDDIFDILTITAANNVSKEVVNRSIMVWKNGQEVKWMLMEQPV